MGEGQDNLPPSEGAAKRSARAILKDLAQLSHEGIDLDSDQPLAAELEELANDPDRLPAWLDDMATPEQIEAAQEKHCYRSNDEIEVDSDARASDADDAY